jgi:hypothetical protein
MRRREFLLVLGSATTAARALRAQQKGLPVVGLLGAASPGSFAPYLAAFHSGLSETGYVVTMYQINYSSLCINKLFVAPAKAGTQGAKRSNGSPLFMPGAGSRPPPSCCVPRD